MLLYKITTLKSTTTEKCSREFLVNANTAIHGNELVRRFLLLQAIHKNYAPQTIVVKETEIIFHYQNYSNIITFEMKPEKEKLPK